MQRVAPVFSFILIFVLAGLVEAAQNTLADSKANDAQAEPAKKPSKAERAKAPLPGGPNDQNAIWWNDPRIVKALSLSEEQQKKMEAYLAAYRKSVPRDTRPDAFHETLVQGNWKDANAENEKVAKTAEASVRLRGKLKIDVLSLLSAEQRQKLVDQFPRLIYKRWLRAMQEPSSG